MGRSKQASRVLIEESRMAGRAQNRYGEGSLSWQRYGSDGSTGMAARWFDGGRDRWNRRLEEAMDLLSWTNHRAGGGVGGRGGYGRNDGPQLLC